MLTKCLVSWPVCNNRKGDIRKKDAWERTKKRGNREGKRKAEKKEGKIKQLEINRGRERSKRKRWKWNEEIKKRIKL